jgi:hypothetical protein
VQIDQLNTTLSREISGHRGSAFHHSHNRFAGMVDYNSFCVSNGTPSDSQLSPSSFRLVVLFTEALDVGLQDCRCLRTRATARLTSFARTGRKTTGFWSSDACCGTWLLAVDMAPASLEYESLSGSTKGRKGGKLSRKGRRSSADEMGNLSARMNAELNDAEVKGRSDVGGMPTTPVSQVRLDT